MQVWKNRVDYAARSVILFGTLFGLAASAVAQQTAGPQLPDSPGTTLAKSQPPAFPQSAVLQSPSSSAPTSSPNQTSPPPPSQGQPAPQKPVGTAAAEPTNAGGIAASQPAGVAIAPAKQRRTRTVVIRTAAIIGAAVAVGTVVALTEATGSKPPGAH
ncbi:MAG: hypothetical protein WBV55_01985 [Candidatus Sulfotelmatobacter sp.]